MAKTLSLIYGFLAYFLIIELLLTDNAVMSQALNDIYLVRRNGNFDTILSEIKSKGSRMR